MTEPRIKNTLWTLRSTFYRLVTEREEKYTILDVTMEVKTPCLTSTPLDTTGGFRIQCPAARLLRMLRETKSNEWRGDRWLDSALRAESSSGSTFSILAPVQRVPIAIQLDNPAL